jgi:hypothetical protein
LLTLKDFFEEARAGRLTGIRCGKCGELSIPPKQFCPGCQERNWIPVPLAGKGGHHLVHGDPCGSAGTRRRSPLCGGGGAARRGRSLLGRIVDIPFDTLRSGLPVRFRPLVKGEETSVGFGPA